MRSIMYAVFNKETNERLFTNCGQSRCKEYVDSHPDNGNLVIRYKWFSF